MAKDHSTGIRLAVETVVVEPHHKPSLWRFLEEEEQ
jgi:hypothetical protein